MHPRCYPPARRTHFLHWAFGIGLGVLLGGALHAQTSPTKTPSTTSAAASKPIQPQNGQWRWTIGTTQSSTTCMPGMAESLLQLLPTQRSESIQFSKPFHPAQLVDNPNISWEQRSPNHFVAVANGITVQGFPLPMNARYELHVLSPTRMRGEATVEMNVWQPCKVTAPFDFQYQGNAAPKTR